MNKRMRMRLKQWFVQTLLIICLVSIVFPIQVFAKPDGPGEPPATTNENSTPTPPANAGPKVDCTKGIDIDWTQPGDSIKKEFQRMVTCSVKEVVTAIFDTQPPPNSNDYKAKGFTDCWFDPTCYFNDWINQLTIGVFKVVEIFFKQMAALPNEFLVQSQKGVIGTYIAGFTDLGYTIAYCFFVFQLVRCLVLFFIEGYADMKGIIVKLITTFALILGTPWAFEKLIELNAGIISGLFDAGITLTTPSGGILKWALLSYLGVTFGSLILLALVIGLLLICIQQVIRVAELVLLYILAPIAISTNMNTEFNYFNPWFKNLLVVIFSQVLQVLTLLLIMESFQQSFNINDIPKALTSTSLCFGFIWLAIKTPGWLKEWTYSSGVGQAAMKVGSAAASTATKFIGK